ncbi:hypothetical protein MCEMSHM24_03337 [Comamonadaceae bacterium]
MDAEKSLNRELMDKSGLSDKKFIPNQVPLLERWFNLLSSVVLLAYGTYGVWINDLYIPAKRGNGVHLHDLPAGVMFAAFFSAAVVMISVCIDHYDRRNNEVKYQWFARVVKLVGWGFFCLSFSIQVSGYVGGLNGLGLMLAVFSVSMVFVGWFGFMFMKRDRENKAQIVDWRADETKALAVTSGYPGAERFHNKAETMQYTEEPRYNESTLQSLVVKRILRNASGDYFFWMWSSDSPQYLKQITQVNAKLLLKQNYVAPE